MAGWTNWPVLGHPGRVGQAGQGVELTENRNHRAVATGLTDQRGGHTSKPGGDPETVLFEHPDMFGGRTVFLEAEFRHVPDAIGKRFEIIAMGVDQRPDGIGIRGWVGHVGLLLRRRSLLWLGRGVNL